MLVDAVILAAGGSRRFGSPKQVAAAAGRPLLAGAVAAATRSRCDRVAVVTGSNRELVEEILRGSGVDTVHNPGWMEGIASSIRCAVRHLMKVRPEVEAALFMTCDQPLLTSDILDLLIATAEREDSTMAACEYAGTIGVPALFSRRRFPELLALEGDRGAGRLLRGNEEDLARVPWPEGEIDIDTPEDLADLRRGCEGGFVLL